MMKVFNRLCIVVNICLVSIAIVASASAQTETAEECYEKGMSQYEEGDFSSALSSLHTAADQGSSLAQAQLGYMFRNGKGVEKDYKLAVKWYRMAVDQENAYAQNNLGCMYHNGEGVTQNYKEAVRLWGLSAEQGNVYAKNNLARANNFDELSLRVYMSYQQVVKAVKSDLHLRTVENGYSRRGGGAYRIVYGAVQESHDWTKGSFNWFGNKARFQEVIFVQSGNEVDGSQIAMSHVGTRMWFRMPADTEWNAFADSLCRVYGNPISTQSQLIWSYGPTTLLLDRHEDQQKSGCYLFQWWGEELTLLRIEQERQKIAELDKASWKK